VLDGEIVGDNFNAVQHRVHRERELDIKIAASVYPCVFEIFDILQVNGEDLTKRPLLERKEILAEALDGERIQFVPFVAEKGTVLFEQIKKEGGEGIIAKRKLSTYQVGKRSPDWLKIKTFKEAEFYVAGLLEGERALASLILAEKVDGKWVYRGEVGSGISDCQAKIIREVLSRIRGDCPFERKPSLDRKLLFWIRPIIKCEVKFLEMTGEGKLRHPSFKRFIGGR